MKPYETRLLRASVAGLPEDKFFWRLMEPAWNDTGAGTPGQQAFARVTYFLRDSANGGLHQALWNRASSEISAVVADLERLGALQLSALVRDAERLLLGQLSPIDLDERRDRIQNRVSGWRNEDVDALDAQLQFEEDLWPLFRQYVEAHPSELFRD